MARLLLITRPWLSRHRPTMRLRSTAITVPRVFYELSFLLFLPPPSARIVSRTRSPRMTVLTHRNRPLLRRNDAGDLAARILHGQELNPQRLKLSWTKDKLMPTVIPLDLPGIRPVTGRLDPDQAGEDLAERRIFLVEWAKSKFALLEVSCIRVLAALHAV